MFVYWSTVIFLKLKFLCKKGFFVFALCFRFVFSLCAFALCFRFVFSFCVFALCFRFVFSLCVFVLCFRFVFSLSVFVLKTPSGFWVQLFQVVGNTRELFSFPHGQSL